MAQLLIRNIPETVKNRLRTRAARNGRSLEGEVREILTAVARERPLTTSESPGIGTQLIEVFRPAAGFLEIPPRSKDEPRPVKFRR